jgi:hypothetical protein
VKKPHRNRLARFYGPKDEIKNGEYKLPAIYRVDDIDFLKEQGMLPADW